VQVAVDALVFWLKQHPHVVAPGLVVIIEHVLVEGLRTADVFGRDLEMLDECHASIFGKQGGTVNRSS